MPPRAADVVGSFMKEICPNNNDIAGNYYEIKKSFAILNFRIVKSMFAPMVTCYFGTRPKAWIDAQYVMNKDT